MTDNHHDALGRRSLRETLGAGPIVVTLMIAAWGVLSIPATVYAVLAYPSPGEVPLWLAIGALPVLGAVAILLIVAAAWVFGPHGQHAASRHRLRGRGWR